MGKIKKCTRNVQRSTFIDERESAWYFLEKGTVCGVENVFLRLESELPYKRQKT